MSAARDYASLSSKGKILHSSPGGYFAVDFTTLPIFEATYVGVVDDAAFRAYLDSLVSILELRRPYALLADASKSGAPSARQRQMQADVIRERKDEFASYCRGAAFIIDSAIVRGALTAMLWLQPLPYEHRVVSTREEAMAFLGARLGLR